MSLNPINVDVKTRVKTSDCDSREFLHTQPNERYRECSKSHSSNSRHFYSDNTVNVTVKSPRITKSFSFKKLVMGNEIRVAHEDFGNLRANPSVRNGENETEIPVETKVIHETLSKGSLSHTLSISNTNGESCLDTIGPKEESPASNFQAVLLRNDTSSATAKLSAQVMNVPYTEFKKSLSFHAPGNTYNTNKMTNIEILNRIRQAYDACNCKVCECIDTITIPIYSGAGKTCKPKLPYQYNYYNNNMPRNSNVKSCSCMNCTNPKSVLRSENISSSETFLHSKTCDCTSCQCVDCKFMSTQNPRTVIVAPVGENPHREDAICRCSPCECMQCGQIYGTITTTSHTHDMGTGINRHRNCQCETCVNEVCDEDGVDHCRCDTAKDRVVRKPVQKDTNDYDIRTTIISNVKPFNQENSRKYKFTFVEDDAKMDSASFNETRYVYGTSTEAQQFYEVSECTYCDCIKCGDNVHSNRSLSLQSSLICNPCGCIECRTFTRKYVKDGKSLESFGKRLESKCRKIQREDNGTPVKISNDISYTSMYSTQDYFINPSSSTNELNSRVSFSNRKDCEKVMSPHNTISNQVPDSRLKAKLSSAPYVNHISDPVTRESRLNNSDESKQNNTMSSWQSSCNSSGHDHSDYLIRFPRTTAETCLNEVMKVNLDKKLKFNRVKMNSNEYDVNRTTSPWKFENEHYGRVTKIERDEVIPPSRSKRCHNMVAGEPCHWNVCEYAPFPKSKLKNRETDYCSCNNYDRTCLKEDSLLKNNNCTQTFRKCSENCLDCKNINNIQSNFFTYTSQNSSENNVNNNNGGWPWNIICPSNTYFSNKPEYHSVPTILDDFNGGVYNTLKGAREFSLELLRVLEKYERANREFQSTSEKLRLSHESLLEKISGQKFSKHLTEKSLHEAIILDENIKDMNYKVSSEECQMQVSEYSAMTMKSKLNLINENNTTQSDKETVPIDFATFSSYIFNEVSKMLLKKTGKFDTVNIKKHRKLIKKANRKITKHLADISSTEGQQNYIDKSQMLEKELLKDFRNENYENKKLCNPDLDNTTHNTNTVKVKKFPESNINGDGTGVIRPDEETSIGYTSNVSSQLIFISEAMKKLAKAFGPYQSHDLDTLPEKDESVTKNLGGLETTRDDIKKMSSSKEIVPPLKAKNKTTIKLEQGLDDKEAIKFVTLHMTGTRHTVEEAPKPSYENKALANLKLEVEKLLDMPQLQSENAIDIDVNIFEKSNQEYTDMIYSRSSLNQVLNYPREKSYLTTTLHTKESLNDDLDVINLEPKRNDSIYSELKAPFQISAKRSFDALKIRFQGVRRISDHTIIVKWDPPQDTRNIKGYELQIDGRAVQKVLGPSRCMAVITCLPQVDKLLITIKTLITTISNFDTCPTSTFIYRAKLR